VVQRHFYQGVGCKQQSNNMIIVKAEKLETGGCKLPDDFIIPKEFESLCDGENYYFFETQEEKDQFYRDRNNQ